MSIHNHSHDHSTDKSPQPHHHHHSNNEINNQSDHHSHSHEPFDNPGVYTLRKMPRKRKYSNRAFCIGIGGPVGSGKTALMLSLCLKLRDQYNLCAVTNDIFTREDGEFLIKNNALTSDRILAVETGGCPHAAIREDITANMLACEELTMKHNCNLILLESGGDNLAADFSRELADFTIYVIDTAGGDKVPRKGGPGITQSDLLVINKIDLAPAVGASLDVMRRDAHLMRSGIISGGKSMTIGPVVFAQIAGSSSNNNCTTTATTTNADDDTTSTTPTVTSLLVRGGPGTGTDEIIKYIEDALLQAGVLTANSEIRSIRK